MEQLQWMLLDVKYFSLFAYILCIICFDFVWIALLGFLEKIKSHAYETSIHAFMTGMYTQGFQKKTWPGCTQGFQKIKYDGNLPRDLEFIYTQ